jgi:hypothetical protein
MNSSFQCEIEENVICNGTSNLFLFQLKTKCKANRYIHMFIFIITCNHTPKRREILFVANTESQKHCSINYVTDVVSSKTRK